MCCRLSGFTLTPVDTRSSQCPIHLDLNLKPVKNKYLSTLSKHCQLASSQPQTYFSKAVYPHLFPNVLRLCQAFTKHCGTRKPALYAASDPGRWVALWLVSCSRWFDGFNVHRMDKAGGGVARGAVYIKSHFPLTVQRAASVPNALNCCLLHGGDSWTTFSSSLWYKRWRAII